MPLHVGCEGGNQFASLSGLFLGLFVFKFFLQG